MKRFVILLGAVLLIGACAKREKGVREIAMDTPGLVAMWDFGGESPLSALGNPGLTLEPVQGIEAPTLEQDGPLSGQSLHFDGGEYLRLPFEQTGALNIQGGQVSVVAWIKWQKGQTGFVGGMWDESTQGGKRQYGLFVSLPYYNGQDAVCGHISKTGKPTPPFPYSIDYSASGQTVPDGQWCTVGFTYDGKHIRSYLNGIFEERAPELINHTIGFEGYPDGLVQCKNPYFFPDGLGSNGSDFTLGAVLVGGRPGNFFRGNIGGIAVYSRALSDAEMLSLSPACFEGAGIQTDSIYCRDPFIVADAATKTYYLYRTSTTDEGLGGVEVFKSKDLNTWSGPKRVFTAPEDNFINGPVWAPEVHYYKGAWYLFATLNSKKTWADKVPDWPAFTYRGTQIFRSESPEGPFLPLGKEPTTPKDFMALDGTLWVQDGVPYMIFCHEWVQVIDGTFELMPLTEDLSAAAGEPVTIFSASQGPWVSPVNYWTEADGTKSPGYVSDGNFVYRTKDGELLILWSSFKDGKYCIAISRSASGSIAGPWTCDPEPIFEQDGGHPMVFKDFDGSLKLVFHQPNSGFSHPVILEIEDIGKTIVIKNE